MHVLAEAEEQSEFRVKIAVLHISSRDKISLDLVNRSAGAQRKAPNGKAFMNTSFQTYRTYPFS